MAVKKTLTSAVPYSEDGKVIRWEFEMKYEQGTEGKDTPKAAADWTKKELEDLCPITQWDAVFASQYDSVITNPKKEPVRDDSFVIPS